MSLELLPDGLPELQKGSHASPKEGACLMEYVSLLAGEHFTDRPRCVDPLLVRLAWAVNDTAEAELRAGLPELAPSLIGTATGNPLAAPAIVRACCRYARAYLQEDRTPLTRAELRAEKRFRRVSDQAADGRSVKGDRLYRFLHAEPPMHEVVRVVATKDPAALPALLRVALTALDELQP